MNEETKCSNDVFSIVDRCEQLVVEHDPMKKIEQFARICYRSEDKIKDNSSIGLIKHCINNNHTSVLEHFYISVFFPSEGHYKEILGDDRMTPSYIWNSCDSIVKRTFINEFWDRHIRINKDIPAEQTIVWRCSVGNLTTWRSIVADGLEASIKQDVYPAIVLHVALLKTLHNVAPIFFQDIVDWFDAVVTVSLAPGNALSKIMEDLDRRDYALENIPDSKIGIGLVAAEAIGYSASFIVETDRAVSHQLVRHRIGCSYSQESQRYCDYSKRGIGVCHPVLEPSKYTDLVFNTEFGYIRYDSEACARWVDAVRSAGHAYYALKAIKLPSETARGILPNDTATKIGVTMTFSALEHWFDKRLEKVAQYSIRSMATRVLKLMIDSDHPVLVNINPRSMIRWAKWLVEQNNHDIEYWKKVLTDQEERAAAIRKEQEARRLHDLEMRRMEAEAAEQEDKK